MIFKFRIISDEVDDFLREIKIDSESSFYDLHEAILTSTGYKDDQMTSFFICDDDWEKEIEITLEDMGNNNSEEDTFVMKNVRLGELLEDEKQKLLYVFDPFAERVFFIELSEIITGKDLQHAICSRKEGNPPQQTIDFDAQMGNSATSTDLDENFYGNQDFDIDDFDPDGFNVGSEGNPYDDDRY